MKQKIDLLRNRGSFSASMPNEDGSTPPVAKDRAIWKPNQAACRAARSMVKTWTMSHPEQVSKYRDEVMDQLCTQNLAIRDRSPEEPSAKAKGKGKDRQKGSSSSSWQAPAKGKGKGQVFVISGQGL
jgi:hypothetical protein